MNRKVRKEFVVAGIIVKAEFFRAGQRWFTLMNS